MRKVIIDCDPGHDDLIAIMVALAHQDELDILGFTTVSGNQTIEKVTNNMLAIVDHFKANKPVYAGCYQPMVRTSIPQVKAHGETGMDGSNMLPPVSKKQDLHAVEYLAKTLKEAEEKITIITLGPLTNIGMLFRLHPELTEKIECIAMMGGGVGKGNSTVKAEFNMWHDPEAAKIVFNSGVKIIMAGLEVCYSGSVLLTETETFKDSTGKASSLYYGLMKFYNGYAIDHGWDRTAIFDATPIIYLLRPELFYSEEMAVDVETQGKYTEGMTVCDTRGYAGEIENPKTVLLSVDREKFVNFLFESIRSLD